MVLRQYENRRTAPYPSQLTYEPLSGHMAPSSYIQELIILELGQIVFAELLQDGGDVRVAACIATHTGIAITALHGVGNGRLSPPLANGRPARLAHANGRRRPFTITTGTYGCQ